MATPVAETSTQKRLITVDTIMDVPDLTEIVAGELEEKPMAGYIHSLIIVNLLEIIGAFVKANQLGRCFPDGLSYTLHVDENNVPTTRIPDFSFMRRGSLPDFDRRRPVPGAPTLAVEVISPTESVKYLRGKINDLLTYGTEAVWVIYPDAQELQVHEPNSQTIRVYRADDTLQAESLFPGLSFKLSDLFQDDDTPDEENTETETTDA